MKRLLYLVGIAGGLTGAVTLIGCVTEWKFPLNRHPLDNPQTIRYLIDNQGKMATHPTGQTSKVP